MSRYRAAHSAFQRPGTVAERRGALPPLTRFAEVISVIAQTSQAHTLGINCRCPRLTLTGWTASKLGPGSGMACSTSLVPQRPGREWRRPPKALLTSVFPYLEAESPKLGRSCSMTASRRRAIGIEFKGTN